MRRRDTAGGQVPLGIPGWQRGWPPLVLAAILVFSATGPLCAQPVAPATSPEQPDWEATSTGETDAPLPSEEPALAPTPVAPLPEAPEKTPSLSATSPAANLALRAQMGIPPGDLNPPVSRAYPPSVVAENSVGVPQAGNFFLPDFDSFYGKPFFERQGLKFRFGPVHLRMSLSTGVEYNDNIFGSSTNKVADYIGRITPTFNFGTEGSKDAAKDFFTLSYAPSFEYYYEQKERNRTNQNLTLKGQATFSRYSTDVSLAYTTSDSPNATQTGGTEYSTISFLWNNRYFLTGKAFLQAAITATIQDSENNNNYQTFAFSPQVGYEYSPKTTIFAGPFAGIAYIGDGGTQTFQGLNVGMNYSNLRKLTFKGTLGVQARQFDGSNSSGSSNFITPVFDFQLGYEAGINTDVTFSLVRDVAISDFQRGLTYTTSSATLGLSQKLFGKVSFNLGLSYQLLEYDSDNSSQGRTDNYISATPSLGYSFWKDTVLVSVFFRRQQRTSDLDAINYDVNAYGFSVSYSF